MLEEMEILIAKIKLEFSEVVGRYKSNNVCSAKEKEFWKKPIVGGPNVAGYNWFLSPASIFVGHYFKEFIPNLIPD